MNPNTLITLKFPAEPPPDIVLAPLPAWERAYDPEAGRADVQVTRIDGIVYIRAKHWQWEAFAFVVEALRNVIREEMQQVPEPDRM
jgi:hypothetical protein